MTDLTSTIARLRELMARKAALPDSNERANVGIELDLAGRNALPALLDAAERAEFAAACSQTDIDKRIAADTQRDLALAAKDFYAERALSAETERDRLRERVAALEGRMCLVCGRAEPCAETPDACTFDPDPISAAQMFHKRAIAAEAERDRLRAMVDQDTAELTGPVYEQIKALTVERDRLAARVTELEAALRPFARWSAVVDWSRGPHTEAPPHLREEISICLSGETGTGLETLTVGDFRRARSLLTPETTNDQG